MDYDLLNSIEPAVAWPWNDTKKDISAVLQQISLSGVIEMEAEVAIVDMGILRGQFVTEQRREQDAKENATSPAYNSFLAIQSGSKSQKQPTAATQTKKSFWKQPADYFKSVFSKTQSKDRATNTSTAGPTISSVFGNATRSDYRQVDGEWIKGPETRTTVINPQEGDAPVDLGDRRIMDDNSENWDISGEDWPGWPLDDGSWAASGQHTCILLSKQLRDPIYDGGLVIYRYVPPKCRIGPIEHEISGTRGNAAKKVKDYLLNLLVVTMDVDALGRDIVYRSGLVMIREDHWSLFKPVRKKIRLG
jgi:hypothetical protein